MQAPQVAKPLTILGHIIARVLGVFDGSFQCAPHNPKYIDQQMPPWNLDLPTLSHCPPLFLIIGKVKLRNHLDNNFQVLPYTPAIPQT